MTNQAQARPLVVCGHTCSSKATINMPFIPKTWCHLFGYFGGPGTQMPTRGLKDSFRWVVNRWIPHTQASYKAHTRPVRLYEASTSVVYKKATLPHTILDMGVCNSQGALKHRHQQVVLLWPVPVVLLWPVPDHPTVPLYSLYRVPEPCYACSRRPETSFCKAFGTWG